MRCPYCGGESKVVDSRPLLDGIRRRRECHSCARRFTTHERLAIIEIRVLKTGARGAEDFQGSKIIRAIERVCRGRKISRYVIEKTARKIEMELIDQGLTSIRSRVIAGMVLKELADIDPIAFERFAVNYAHAPSVGPGLALDEERDCQYSLFDE